MFKTESDWIAHRVSKFSPEARTLIDIGSESSDYRDKIQKHIAELYAHLKAKGLSLATLDSDPGTNPDFVQDITLPLNGIGTYDVVLASNVLEHISINKLDNAVDNLFSLSGPDGIVVITVPFNLPRHDRPIDNMLRPMPDELAEIVGHTALVTEQWQDIHYREPYISDIEAPAPIVTGGVFRQGSP